MNCLSDLNNEFSLFYLFYRWKSLYVFVGPTKTTLNKGFRTKLYISFFPHFLSFAENIGYDIELATFQNWDPDLTFICKKNRDIKFAVDLKTT